MDDKEYLFEAVAILTFGSGNSFSWKKEDDDGNKIPDDDRVSYENLIVRNTSKPTEAEVNAKIQELKDDKQTAINKKASGKQKLKDLGLDDDELQALMGV
jgi:hypothetical protein|tara:strand:- start:6 stop:305 length:300 start_codon:yes stop_codon:yes gene_type:complete